MVDVVVVEDVVVVSANVMGGTRVEVVTTTDSVLGEETADEVERVNVKIEAAIAASVEMKSLMKSLS